MSVDLVVKNAKLVSPRGITEAGVAVKNVCPISTSELLLRIAPAP